MKRRVLVGLAAAKMLHQEIPGGGNCSTLADLKLVFADGDLLLQSHISSEKVFVDVVGQQLAQ